MQTITEVISGKRYTIRRINRVKRYLILSVEGVHPCLYVPFDLVPASVMFALTGDIEPSPDNQNTCNEPGERYGRIINKTQNLSPRFYYGFTAANWNPAFQEKL